MGLVELLLIASGFVALLSWARSDNSLQATAPSSFGQCLSSNIKRSVFPRKADASLPVGEVGFSAILPLLPEDPGTRTTYRVGRPWLDPLVLLSMFAARTQRTRLMTGILLAGLRRPATLAKMLSTLDTLSCGRLDIGVGVGWQREEYEANGVSFEGRGAHLDETLAICQTLWRNESAAYHSASVQFENVHLNPKPLQPGGVPLWISGRLNKNVLQRIVRFGAGWIPWGQDAMNPLAGLERIRGELARAGRDSGGFQCTSYLPVVAGDNGKLDLSAMMAPVGSMVEGGVTDIRVTLPLPLERTAVQDYLRLLVEAFRETVGRPGAITPAYRT